jgi:hypothetical protein
MTPERTALLKAISQLAERYPNWRFGQLISNVAGWADADLWNIEDEQILAAALAHLEQLEPIAAESKISVS